MSVTIYQMLLLIFLCLPLLSSFSTLGFRSKANVVKAISLSSMAFQLLILIIFAVNNNLYGWTNFGPIVVIPWLGQWGIQFAIGLDGIAFPFLLISAILAPLIFLTLPSILKEQSFAVLTSMYQLLLFGMYGSYLAVDLVFFYIFWELVLVPIFIMVGLLGGELRQAALMKFLLYSLGGSLLMLLGILTLGIYHQIQFGSLSFNFFVLQASLLPWGNSIWSSPQWWVCGAFLVAMFIKGHVFPLHSWLPDLYQQGNPMSTVCVSALLFNMASYGMIRFLPLLFPEAIDWWSTPLMWIGAASIVFGALCVLVQQDMRQILAYMSVSHMGYFLLGFGSLTIAGVQAAYIQTINHAVLAASFSLLIFILGQQRGQYLINSFGGLAKATPIISILLFVSVLGNIGLPGTNGFIGEFLVLWSGFQASPAPTILAATGVIWAACYGLIFYQKICMGKTLQITGVGFKDLRGITLISLVFIILLIIFLGFQPMQLFHYAMPAISKTMTKFLY